jgi:hypothetical protein
MVARSRVAGSIATMERAGKYELVKSVRNPIKIGDSTVVPFPMVSAAAVTIPTLLAVTPGNSIGMVKTVTINSANKIPKAITQIIGRMVPLIRNEPNANNGKVNPAKRSTGLRLPNFDNKIPLNGVATAVAKGITATIEPAFSVVIPWISL